MEEAENTESLPQHVNITGRLPYNLFVKSSILKGVKTTMNELDRGYLPCKSHKGAALSPIKTKTLLVLQNYCSKGLMWFLADCILSPILETELILIL